VPISPLLSPQIEYIVQIYVGEQRTYTAASLCALARRQVLAQAGAIPQKERSGNYSSVLQKRNSSLSVKPIFNRKDSFLSLVSSPVK